MQRRWLRPRLRRFSDAAFRSAGFHTQTVTNVMKQRTRLLCGFALMLLLTAPLFAKQHEEGAADPGWAPAIAKMFNFALLAAGVTYFARGPVGEYFRTRSTTIRKDLVDSKTLRGEAEKQLAAVQQRLSLLPGELADLKKRGEEELASEKVRLADATSNERTRLIEQTRREIELQSRLARRELVTHSVDVSMALARTRIQKDITPEDQARLIDRYAESASTGARA